jgi:multidrug efflux pump subunit AcrA (membrane-fusion protein)
MRNVIPQAGSPVQTIALSVISPTAFALIVTSGCVMQSTYDAAVQDTLTTRTELARALEEQTTLTRQVRDMEMQNADAVRQAEASVAALRQAQDEADRERQQIEQQRARLRQKVAQATKQQHALKYELTVAKENGAALQEMIDAYERKIRDDGPIPPAAEPAVHKPFDPSTIPVPQDLPPAPAASAPQPLPPPTPAAAPAANPAKASRPSADEGWFTSIKNWLVSVWQSVFP